jgi:penicillin-binding protein 1C
MILGGCGVRLEELTALYAAFGNEGRYYPPRFVAADASCGAKDSGTTVISPAAAYMLGTILKDLHRPDLPNLHEQASNIPRIAWKTGTSYGRRDAWSIGYNSRYTIGVWIGNFSGQGVASLNGAGTATPLLFRLFHALDAQVSEDWLRQPQDLSFRLVCAQSGNPPETCCTEQVMDYYIPGRSSNNRCNHLREVCIAADERFAYCTSCVPATGYKKKVYANPAPDLLAFYESGNIPYQKMPPHNPGCARTFDGAAPVINSLTENMTYIIVDRGSQLLQLGCQTASDVKKVYWYINDRFLSAAPAGEKIFFSPQDPELKISCTDDKGRNADIRVKVKFI